MPFRGRVAETLLLVSRCKKSAQIRALGRVISVVLVVIAAAAPAVGVVIIVQVDIGCFGDSSDPRMARFHIVQKRPAPLNNKLLRQMLACRCGVL